MTITAERMWLDGQLVATAGVRVPVMGHALQRGSLVFDVGSFHETAPGPALFRADAHAARFVRSSKIVGLALRYDEAALVEAAVRVVRESGVTRGLVRWSAFFAAAEPDLIPRDDAVRVAVAVQSLQDPPSAKPIGVAVFADARKAAPDALPPEAKASASYLGPMLARKRAIAEGADEVVLLDTDGDIAEAPIANAFAVIDGTLWTPSLGRILPGITRASVLALARSEGIPIREERLPREAFLGADEAFLTATSLPIAPIGRLNARVLDAPGPITRRLVERMTAVRHGTDPEHAAWLTAVR